jgi:hypothetical protein
MDHNANQKNFFEGLQSLSESMKQRILVVSTIVIMVVVVYVWLGYFNGIVANNSQSDQTIAQSVPQQTEPAASGPNFWQKMESGMANIVGVFKQPGQYNVQPQ